jgi:hypothetical protein
VAGAGSGEVVIDLDRQIQGWLDELGVPSWAGQWPFCAAATEDARNLAEHICINKDDLCRITRQRPRTDVWALEKCRSARQSCLQVRRATSSCEDGPRWPLIF